MSLVMAIANKNGIVVSGDRRLTIQKTYHGETEFTNTYYNDRTQKIYISERGHVFGIAGCAISIDGRYIPDILPNIIRELDKESLTLKEELVIIQNELRHNIVNPASILCAGIENGENVIFRTSTDIENSEIISKTDGVYGGDAIGMYTTALNIIKESGIHTYDLSLSELVDFMQSVNSTTAKSIKKIKSVSEKCDIVAITPEYGAKWVLEDRSRIYELK